jgi:hypothetical protein
MGPRRPLLARHLDKLQEAMEGLSEQTRDALARILAGVVAGLVCEAIRCALSAPDARPLSDPWPQRQPGSPRTLLDTLDDLDLEYVEGPPELRDDTFPGRTTPDQPLHASTPSDGSMKLALGLRVAAWWLARGKGPKPLLAALALGTAATTAAVLGGPPVLAGLGLAVALLDVVRLGTTVYSARRRTGFSNVR